MKKTFTLLFALGLFALAQAQPGSRDSRQRDDRRYDNDRTVVITTTPHDNTGRYDNGFVSLTRKRDMEIARINREYDYKISRVSRSFFGSRYEKQRKIRLLENQRQREISRVYAQYKRDTRYDNRRY